MKPIHIVAGLGATLIVALAGWYMYMQQTPSYERTYTRGLPPEVAARGDGDEAAGANPAANPAGANPAAGRPPQPRVTRPARVRAAAAAAPRPRAAAADPANPDAAADA
ncbi:MAG: hypothetical protein H6703_07290 [Myxococcales bacterium]|nr:hypothetical protein [Myxococcales bacterium]